ALDLESEGDSHHSVTDSPLLTPQLMELFTMVYVGSGDGMMRVAFTCEVERRRHQNKSVGQRQAFLLRPDGDREREIAT
ncbi:hypothetical protein ACC687_42170, partial [Rhizobium ruizarguesonis]